MGGLSAGPDVRLVRCPKCGEPPIGTVDSILCVARMIERDDGSFEYVGDSDVAWDTQETTLKRGLPVLECADGHTFTSRHFHVS